MWLLKEQVTWLKHQCVLTHVAQQYEGKVIIEKLSSLKCRLKVTKRWQVSKAWKGGENGTELQVDDWSVSINPFRICPCKHHYYRVDSANNSAINRRWQGSGAPPSCSLQNKLYVYCCLIIGIWLPMKRQYDRWQLIVHTKCMKWLGTNITGDWTNLLSNWYSSVCLITRKGKYLKKKRYTVRNKSIKFINYSIY